MQIEIKKLTSDLMSDFFHFFDHIAFTDNPKWASCYCQYYYAYVSNEQWECRTALDNRAETERMIRAQQMHGFLAYADGLPVGWCHANSKASFPGLHQRGPEAPLDTTAVTICFIIAPHYRRKGIAHQLLAFACDSLQQDGYTTVEGYPLKSDESEAANYLGPFEMYLKNGFAVVQDEGKSVVVQKSLLVTSTSNE